MDVARLPKGKIQRDPSQTESVSETSELLVQDSSDGEDGEEDFICKGRNKPFKVANLQGSTMVANLSVIHEGDL